MSMNISPRVAAYMTAVVAMWSLTATVETVTLSGLTPLQFGAWGTAFGTAGAALVTFLRGNGRRLAAYGVKNHLRLFVCSLLGFGVYFALKFTAYTISPPPQANVLQYTFTLFIVLFAVPFMGQPLPPMKLAGVLVGFAGAAVVMTGGNLSAVETAFLPGYFCAVGAGVSFALFSVLSDVWRLSGMSALVYFHAYSSAVLFLALALKGELAVPSSAVSFGGVFYSGFVTNVMGIYLWLAAQRESDDVSVLTGILYLIPFFSLLSFKFYLGLVIPLSAYAGLALIVAGLTIHRLRKPSGLKPF